MGSHMSVHGLLLFQSVCEGTTKRKLTFYVSLCFCACVKIKWKNGSKMCNKLDTKNANTRRGNRFDLFMGMEKPVFSIRFSFHMTFFFLCIGADNGKHTWP